MEAVTIVVLNHAEPQCEETVDQLRAALSQLRLPSTIYVSDDPEGRGIGWAAREGLRHVTTPWVAFAMADGSEDSHRVAAMVQQCDAHLDAVWGDRWTGQTVVHGYPWLKRICNRLGNRLIARMLHSDYTDWTDLAKAYRVKYLRRIAWSDDFRCEIEMPIRYLWAVQVVHWPQLMFIPMRWTERTAGRSAFRLWRAWQMLWALFTVWRLG
jgi:glycosyltransferase involved in cell wall biosynthesis